MRTPGIFGGGGHPRLPPDLAAPARRQGIRLVPDGLVRRRSRSGEEIGCGNRGGMGALLQTAIDVAIIVTLWASVAGVRRDESASHG